MTKRLILQPRVMAAVALALLFSLAAIVPGTAVAHGNKDGLDIKIRAENRSVDDTPAACSGVGPGEVGDRLDVDVTTDIDGTASGTAVFTAADGTTTVLNVDEVFVYFGGLALQDSSNRNTVAIWLGDIEENGPSVSPVHVNLEVPRGCQNTVSTFTIDADKVTTQIKFQ